MTSPAGAAEQARSSAVAELFDALEGLLIAYQALPNDERHRKWSGDAERITGEVARHLGTARSRIARSQPQLAQPPSSQPPSMLPQPHSGPGG